MIILHPYGEDRPADKAETWTFLEPLRGCFNILDLRVQRETYPDTMGLYWGKEDIIIIEDDKVPTYTDFYELLKCMRLFCIFPYPPSMSWGYGLEMWKRKFPYGMGFVKFSLEAQKAVPFSAWDRTFRNDQFDRIIEVPMIKKLGPMHLHERMIRHNHRPTIQAVAKNLARKILRGEVV